MLSVVNANECYQLGFSGVMLRGSGICWDLRCFEPYDMYNKFNFNIIVGQHGDCYDRYLIRVNEMKESIRIVKQCLILINIFNNTLNIDNFKLKAPFRSNLKYSMNL